MLGMETVEKKGIFIGTRAITQSASVNRRLKMNQLSESMAMDVDCDEGYYI